MHPERSGAHPEIPSSAWRSTCRAQPYAASLNHAFGVTRSADGLK
ncbi:hypothetical protein UO65_6491 [Actinokineospora spheciospongiae]|uniref:Uncharacterized protein n=1 Tax=Actinokineospora spheciospongiae TaxID=909613 RepID=W7IBR5_9PSEU|nr:hypothetical protein UO65_6491 [Actinokineospora spheciospongiae]